MARAVPVLLPQPHQRRDNEVKTQASEIEQLREATREAHEAIKDLRAAIKEARGLWDEVTAKKADEIDATISALVRGGLDGYEAAMAKAIDEADAMVDARFQRITDILLGEDDKTKRKDQPSIEELAHAKSIMARLGS